MKQCLCESYLAFAQVKDKIKELMISGNVELATIVARGQGINDDELKSLLVEVIYELIDKVELVEQKSSLLKSMPKYGMFTFSDLDVHLTVNMLGQYWFYIYDENNQPKFQGPNMDKYFTEVIDRIN